MSSLTINMSDAAAGILFLLIALVFGVSSLDLDAGSLRSMGPGYFPRVLAVLLGGFGLLILAGSVRSTGEGVGRLAWRGMLFILPAPVFFGLTVRGLGFVPAIFLTTLIAALASFRMGLLWGLVVAAGVTAFSTLVFVHGLGLPFRSFGPWLGL